MTTTSGSPAPPRIRRIQFLSLSLLVLSGAINYVDRATLAVANTSIVKDMGLTLGQMGLLLSAFSWSYALAQLPAGALADRLGARRLLGFGLIAWSLAQGAAGFVQTFFQFVVARILLGIGEAPQFPSAARVVSNWYPPAQRGAPTGVFNAASPLGSALAPLILTQALLVLDWRWLFILTGLAGFFAAALWFALYRDPADLPLTEEERAYLAEDGAKRETETVTFAAWAALFSHRATWGMMLGFFGSVYLNWVYLTWLPAYLVNERHMSLASSGLMASIPFFCGFVGCLVAGWLSDQISQRSASPVLGRRRAVALAMFGMAAFTVPAALAESNAFAVFCISVVIFLANAASACSWALATAVAPPNRVASLGSLQNFGGFLGGALAPIITGFIAQTHGFAPALLVGAGFAFLGALSYLFLVRAPIKA